MIRFTVLTLTLGMLAAGCSNERSQNPSAAQHTYGTPVDATDAIPAPAVAAEDSLYAGRALTVDSRITAIRASGCAMQVVTGATPLVMTAPRPKEGSRRRVAPGTDTGDCAWQVPKDVQGFAVAAGTLRVADDTLRLVANGVRVTPVRPSNLDS